MHSFRFWNGYFWFHFFRGNFCSIRLGYELVILTTNSNYCAIPFSKSQIKFTTNPFFYSYVFWKYIFNVQKFWNEREKQNIIKTTRKPTSENGTWRRQTFIFHLMNPFFCHIYNVGFVFSSYFLSLISFYLIVSVYDLHLVCKKRQQIANVTLRCFLIPLYFLKSNSKQIQSATNDLASKYIHRYDCTMLTALWYNLTSIFKSSTAYSHINFV